MPEIKINELSKGNSTQVSLNSGFESDSEDPKNRILIVDSHEPISIKDKLQQKGIPTDVVLLHSGDYVFSNVGIERKTLRDLWGSITSKDKRIWRQMFELKRNFERPYLIVEEFNFRFLRSPSYSNQIWGALARISLMGINIVTIASVSSGSKEFVDFVNYLYFSADKTKKTYRPLPAKSKDPVDVFKDTICMVPGIGPVTAEKLVGRYRSWEEICEVDRKVLSKLCGRTKVRMLWRVLHGENID